MGIQCKQCPFSAFRREEVLRSHYLPSCITANKNDVLHTVFFSSVFKIEDALCSQPKTTPMEKVGVYMVHVGEGAKYIFRR